MFLISFLHENIIVIKIFWQIYSIFQKKKIAPYLFCFTKNISCEIAQATKSQQQPLSCHNIQLIKATFNQRLLKLKAIIMIKGPWRIHSWCKVSFYAFNNLHYIIIYFFKGYIEDQYHTVPFFKGHEQRPTQQ